MNEYQSPVSDSAQTPPSPVSYSKHRLSRSSTQSKSRRSLSRRSGSSTPTPQFKRDRERQLANVPRDTLLHHTISKEYELREAKHLLTTALIQLEAIREKFIHEHDSRLALETEKKDQAVSSTKALIDTQQEAMDAKEEVRRFQLHLENSQSELHKVRDVVHQLESDKTDLEREIVRARDSARTFKEQNTLLHAREEGRREGFEQGLRQGRAMHGIIDLSQQPPQLPAAEVSNTKSAAANDKSAASRRPSHSVDTEIELRKIAERDSYRLNLQVTQLSRELDQQRQKTKEVEADKKRLLDETARLKRELRTKDEETAKLAERTAILVRQLQISERKGRESAARRESQAVDLKVQLEKLSTDNEKLQKEKEETERMMKEELEKEKERRENDRQTIVPAPSTPPAERRLSYIPMAPPPIPPNVPTSGPVPRATSSGSGSALRRRVSVTSQSSTASTSIDMPQSPPGSANRFGTAGSNSIPHSAPPSWGPQFPQPTIIPPPQSHSPRMMPQQPLNPHFLQPTGNYLYGLPNGQLANGSQSSIQINIEPPSRSPSVRHEEVESPGVFLSPNHQPISLPTGQEPPLPILPRTGRNSNSYDYDTSGFTARPNSPVIPGVTVPMPQPPPRSIPLNGPPTVIDGPLPPGFVPQTITDPNGISTPIWQTRNLSSGAGSVAPPPRSGPIYGNPLNKEREEEDESYVPFSPYGPGSRPGGPNTLPTGRPNGSGPGMTPATIPRNLPGMGPRSGVSSIYAPAPPPIVPPIPMGNTWGYSPGAVIPGPLPHSSPHPEEDENDDVDSETALNTRLNASIGMRAAANNAPVHQDFGRGPGVIPGLGPGLGPGPPGSASGYPNWRR